MPKLRNKQELTEYLLRLQSEGHSMRHADFPRRVTYEIRKHFGSYKDAKESLNLEVRRKEHEYGRGANAPEHLNWTDEEIADELRKAISKHGTTASNYLKLNGDKTVVTAVKRRYGTWNAGLVALGYEVARNTHRNEKARKPPKDIPKKYVPNLMNAAGVKREIIRMWYIGSPLNYSFVAKRRKHLIQAANGSIGSWKQAVESVGLDYKTITKQSDTNVLSECGTEFEDLFADMLTELNFEYSREGEGLEELLPDFKLRPDFILPNWRWIDCKLSEWTDIRETLIKYHSENPSGITIVYLRGQNTRRNRGHKWKFEHVSVYQFTKLLTDDRREYYEGKLRNIEQKADKGLYAS